MWLCVSLVLHIVCLYVSDTAGYLKGFCQSYDGSHQSYNNDLIIELFLHHL